MNISKNIRAIREEKRLRQGEVAEMSKIPQATYSRLERKGGNNISLQHLSQIAKGLGVTVDYILNYSLENQTDSVKEDSKQPVIYKRFLFMKDMSLENLEGRLNDFLRDNPTRQVLESSFHIHQPVPTKPELTVYYVKLYYSWIDPDPDQTNNEFYSALLRQNIPDRPGAAADQDVAGA